MLGGCSGGDFFRTRDNMRSDDMHRWMGAEVTGSVGMKASQFQLTDNERLLRDLAYPLVEPPLSRPAWKSVWGDYKPLPSPWRQNVIFDRTMYGRNLIDEPHRSHMSRYSVLIDDVRSDITRFEPFYTNAARVLDLDRKRTESFRYVSGLTPPEAGNANARIAENQLVVGWVQRSLVERSEAFCFALQRLVIATPAPMAVEVERSLTLLNTRIAENRVIATGEFAVTAAGCGAQVAAAGPVVSK